MEYTRSLELVAYLVQTETSQPCLIFTQNRLNFVIMLAVYVIFKVILIFPIHYFNQPLHSSAPIISGSPIAIANTALEALAQ